LTTEIHELPEIGELVIATITIERRQLRQNTNSEV